MKQKKRVGNPFFLHLKIILKIIMEYLLAAMSETKLLHGYYADP